MVALRGVVLALFVISGLAGLVAGDDHEDSAEEAPPCPERAFMPGVGDVCRAPNGLLAVFDPDGGFQGFSHGPDPIPEPEETAFNETTSADILPGTFTNSPWCVDPAVPPAVEPRARVIYARATDDYDRFATHQAVIRALVTNANSVVHNAGLATGTAANLKVECDADGTVAVHGVELPTPMASASFSTIVRDLKNQGHDDAALKFWIYYDDRGACGCGGMGNLNGDSTPTVANLNNGWTPMYSITFGYDSTRIMLHELGHNLGAVQSDSPHSTRAGHCYDGRDTMCYNDGGPFGNRYSTAYCAAEVWDCGKDDYFHANPETGSYLSLHWNTGARMNRFFVFADSVDTPVVDLWNPAG